MDILLESEVPDNLERASARLETNNDIKTNSLQSVENVMVCQALLRFIRPFV